MIRLHGRFDSWWAATKLFSIRSNSARLATCVIGSLATWACNAWHFSARGFRGKAVRKDGGAVDSAVVAADGNRGKIGSHVPALAAHDADAAEPLNTGRNRMGDGAI